MSKTAEQYFSILNEYFREAYEIASKNKFVKDNYWNKTIEAYDPASAIAIMDSLYEDLKKIDWGSQEQRIRNTGGLKASYTGSVYSYLQNVSQTAQFLKKASLYADTIIINDSILSELWAWQKKGRTGWEISFPVVLNSAIDYLCLKDLFVTDVEPPVCSLAPALVWSLEKENRLNIADNMVYQTETSVASQVFGEEFSSIKELRTFLSKITSTELFFSLAKNITMLGDPNGADLTPAAFQKFRDYFEKKYMRFFDNEEIYESLLRSNFSMVVYDLVGNGKFKSVISTDFKGVWKSLVWLLQNPYLGLSEVAKEKVASRDSFLLHALQEDNIRWLGNIPLSKIREFRERGELQELRDMLGENIETIERVSDEEFFEVGEQVKYNIEQAIRRHSSEVQDLNEMYRKKYKTGTSSLIVSGALAITASVLPPIAWVASILGGTSVYNIIQDFIEKKERIKELQRKPIASLFDAHQGQTRD